MTFGQDVITGCVLTTNALSSSCQTLTSAAISHLLDPSLNATSYVANFGNQCLYTDILLSFNLSLSLLLHLSPSVSLPLPLAPSLSLSL